MTEMSSKQLIDRLVSLHGEGGLCPSVADWEAILARPAGKALNILNLLKFRVAVDGPQGTESGLQAYGRYSAAVGPAFIRAGGKTLYFGAVDHIFGTVEGKAWDAAILTRYPSPEALAHFWLDDEFVKAHAHRANGVDQSRVLVMTALRDG